MNLNRIQSITSEEEYEILCKRCYTLMEKGDENLTKAELEELEFIGSSIIAYEDIHYPFTAEEKARAEVLRAELEQVRV